jgi:hypothetical protein
VRLARIWPDSSPKKVLAGGIAKRSCELDPGRRQTAIALNCFLLREGGELLIMSFRRRSATISPFCISRKSTIINYKDNDLQTKQPHLWEPFPIALKPSAVMHKLEHDERD